MIVFDIESDGLLDTVSKVHCINLLDRSSGREYRFTDHEFYQNVDGSTSDVRTPRDGTIADALDMLATAEAGGHNVLGYDVPALRIVYPKWRASRRMHDSRVMSRVMYTSLKDRDHAAVRKGQLSAEFVNLGLIGKHSLRAWGMRINGVHQKADFDPKDYGHTWATMPFIQAMDDYCMDDVRTNVLIFEHLESKGYAEECLALEHAVQRIITRQEQVGFAFNEQHALKLVAKLQGEQAAMDDELRHIFAPWFTWDGKDRGRTVPKRSMRRFVASEHGSVVRKHKGQEQRGWYEHLIEGVPSSKVKLVVFNPGSRDHIADRLQRVHGWAPTEFTSEGKPKIDETILEALPYAEAKQLAQYFTVQKKLGQIAEGKNAWLKFLRNGRVHGQVNTNGAVTGRMTHSKPNVAQVDKDPDMRACWTVRPDGYVLVGCDAEGLELRCLAHYMALYDGGAYVKTVVEGKKEDGTDMHSVNKQLLQFNSRDNAKTWVYAFLYGAGNYKLGSIVLDDFTEEKRERFFATYPAGKKRDQAIARLGLKSRNRVAEGLPALGMLVEKVKKNAKRGYLKGLDGRRLEVRSEHAALNTLLQSAGAVIMKQALVLLDEALQAEGLKNYDDDPRDYDYEFVAQIHDETQLEVKVQHAERVGRLAADSIRRAGEVLRFRCPLAGAYDKGLNWSETH